MLENPEAEARILGTLINHPEWADKCLDALPVSNMADKGNKALYGLVIDLIEAGNTVGPVGVAEAIRRQPQALQGPLNSSFEQCVAEEGSEALLEEDIGRIKEAYIRRELVGLGERINASASKPEQDLDALISTAEAALLDMKGAITCRKEVSNLVDNIPNILERIKHYQKNKGTLKGRSTPFSVLNNMTNGLQPGNLFILAGRPSMGKTAFALNIGAHLALEGENILISSMEMTAEEVEDRIVFGEAKVESGKVMKGELQEREMGRINALTERLKEGGQIIIDDTGGATAHAIRARAKKIIREYGELGLIIVDYIQLMGGNIRESREQEIAQHSRELKAIAKELSVPMLVISQLNRKVEDRANKRPMMSDLRESGAIEQDADIITFVYRDEYYNPECKDAGKAEIILSKHRNGPTGSFKVSFIKEYARFED